MQLTSGIFLMNHSPRVRTEAPNHDDMKTPTKNMKVIDVTNPRPAGFQSIYSKATTSALNTLIDVGKLKFA